MGRVGWACAISGLRWVQNTRGPGLTFLLVALAEFLRARAAEQRHEDLRRAGAAAPARDDIVLDLPRRIFEEYYS
jgi:hypothetical protein